MNIDRIKRISIIVPCRNERGFIAGFIESVQAQQVPPGCELEILIADGMSDDGTRDVLESVASRDANLRIVDNPGGIAPTGLNLAIAASRGEVIVRMDVHSVYAPDYVRMCLETLLHTGADNVGGPARTRAEGYLQRANALAYHSPFSVGGARFHDIDFEGPADTVPYGCWRREAFVRFGLFDEELVRNQDDEHNQRISRQGGRIWQNPAIHSWYWPRATLGALFRQYAQYGYWKVRVIQKHRVPASMRHLVPAAFIGTLGVVLPLAPFSALGATLVTAVIGSYLAVVLLASLLACRRVQDLIYLPVLPAVFAAYHLGYGYGFWRGLIDFVLLRRGSRQSFERLAR